MSTTYGVDGTAIDGLAIIVVFILLGYLVWRYWPHQRKPGRSRDEYYRFPVNRIRVGDLVDLSGDIYADPNHDPNAPMAFDHYRVEAIEEETRTCTVIHFEQGSFGFPPEHRLRVLKES